MNQKLCVFIQCVPVQLEEDDRSIIKKNSECVNHEVANGFSCCKYVSLVFSSKLGKCLHFQVLAFNITFHCFVESDEEYGEYQGDDESVDSLFNICIVKLKINLHTNLALDAVFGKSSFELLRKWENSKSNAA